MTPEERARIKEHLLVRREKLLKKIEELEALSTVAEPDCAVDSINREGAMQDNMILQENLNKSRIKLAAVEQALKRTGEPGFGKCSRCGSPIPVERLMIMPESDLCVACSRGRGEGR
jgi:DnaK suppressor protein